MEASQHNGSERNGEGDQVHLLVNYPAKRAISTLVNHLKGVSSRLLGIEGPDIERKYWKDVLWLPSYFAPSCGGAPNRILKEYMEQQKTQLT